MNAYKKNLKKFIRKIFGGDTAYQLMPQHPRSDDVYLASYPKSGNTWVAFMIANAISGHLKLDIEPNFFNIHFFVPDIHESRCVPPELQYPPFRRIIKSHGENTRAYGNILLIVRDPRDVMSSYYLYTKNQKIFDGDFSSFIRHEKYGIKAWAHHTESWLERSGRHQNIQIFYYESFVKSPQAELKRLFRTMGFNLSDQIIDRAVEKSNFENMKSIEAETISYSIKRFEKFKFVVKDKLAQNVEVTEADRRYILEIAKPMMDKLGYQ